MICGSEKGFTLVEIVVVAVLTALLAGAGYATFAVYTRETSDAAMQLKGQMQTEALYDAMATAARKANFMLPINTVRTDTANLPNRYISHSDSLLSLRRDSVFFYNYNEANPANNPPFGGFRVTNSDGVVQELIKVGNTLSWVDFKVSGNQVKINRDSLKYTQKNGTKQAFQLVPGAMIKSFEAELTVKVKQNDSAVVNQKIARGVFSCRI
jgi:prepilin-type N-terminal cleavage/methylation domain-containing protein